MVAIVTVVSWNLKVILIFTSFKAKDNENIFMCFSAIQTSSSERVLFRSFAHFFIVLLILGGSLVF
jgi:hypothetical protein